MNIKQAIEHTRKKNGFQVDFSGAIKTRQGGAYIRGELAKHYYQARESWLKGDLETVAEFFGLYV